MLAKIIKILYNKTQVTPSKTHLFHLHESNVSSFTRRALDVVYYYFCTCIQFRAIRQKSMVLMIFPMLINIYCSIYRQGERLKPKQNSATKVLSINKRKHFSSSVLTDIFREKIKNMYCCKLCLRLSQHLCILMFQQCRFLSLKGAANASKYLKLCIKFLHRQQQ